MVMSNEFPLIKNVFCAYLHQDSDLEFGSADEAILAFSSHANDVEKGRALAELDVLLGYSLNEEQLKSVIFDELGCCYFYPAEWSDGVAWLKHVRLLLGSLREKV